MTTTLENAKKIIDRYKYLIGKHLDDERKFPITNILIAPTDPEQYKNFRTLYLRNKNNNKALSQSGFDRENVKVFVAHIRFNLFLHSDCETYINKNQIDKIFD